MKKIFTGCSGGVTSAWVCGWALRNYNKEEVDLVFHDTKEEHPDTYRFIRELEVAINHPIIDYSDGRSVTELFYENNALANNRMAFCSRILKQEMRDKYIAALRSRGFDDITLLVGYSSMEWQRIQKATMRAELAGIKIRFPIVEENITKQQCADWCNSIGVKPSDMYKWSEHANCIGCVRGGKAYWLAVFDNEPEVYAKRAALEMEFGHTFIKDTSLLELSIRGMDRKVSSREKIEITCECGD
jgi:hypothetical protein